MIITIDQGKLKGKKEVDVYGKEYYSFQSIPYAKPPVGKLRFKPPEAAESWGNDIFDATVDIPACPSIYAQNFMPEIKTFSEDCLRLNVYTPVNLSGNINQLIPVMVAIHGGAFLIGTSHRNYYGPDFLMNKNVVLVTFNYRLGVLGFLKLADRTLNVSGNAGLKDMVEALKWIQKNIKKFAGDPNNVTIFGSSAGGSATNALLLSPLSKGLFHKAIIQSGAAIIDYAVSTRKDDSCVAKVLGCTSNDPKIMLEFLQERSLQEILDGQLSVDDSQTFPAYQCSYFIPVVEDDHPQAFMSEHPLTLLKKKKIHSCPIMIGYIENDGTSVEMFSRTFKPDFENGIIEIPLFEKVEMQSKDLIDKIEKLLYLYYYKGEKPSYKNKNIFYKATTDIMYAHMLRKVIKLINKNSNYPIFYYKFSLQTKLNIKQGFLKHSDDERYLISRPATRDLIKPGSDEERAVDLMTTFWTNFAKTGDPNSDTVNVIWKPVTEHELNCLDINAELRCGTEPNLDRLEFVETLFSLGTKSKI